jgi:hypothetical protein
METGISVRFWYPARPPPTGQTWSVGLRNRNLIGEQEVNTTVGTVRFVVAIATVVVIGAITALIYETKWPPHIEDRELSRIGPPFRGAQAVKGPYNVSGSPLCIDSCVIRGRFYLAQGTLTSVVAAVSEHLAERGYVLDRERCFEDGPPTLRQGSYELSCAVSGRRGKFTATAVVKLRDTNPIVPMLTSTGQYALSAPPPASTVLRPGDGVLVEVNN